MKTILKMLDFAAYGLLVLFAAMFAAVCLACLFCGIAEGEFMSFIGAAASGFAAWCCWTVKADIL